MKNDGKINGTIRSVIYGLIFSAGPYLIMYTIAYLTKHHDVFATDYLMAANAFMIGFLAGGVTLYKYRLINIAEELDILQDEKAAKEWTKNLRDNILAKRQYIFGIILAIVLFPMIYPIIAEVVDIYGTFFFVVYIIVYWVTSVVLLYMCLWIMLALLFWIYTSNVSDDQPFIVKLGWKFNTKINFFFPVNNLDVLSLKIKLFHHDKTNGLKPLIRLALFGSLINGVFAAILIIVCITSDLINVGNLLEITYGLIVSIALTIFIFIGTLFNLLMINKMGKKARIHRIKEICARLEDKVDEILSKDENDYETSLHFLDVHERLLEKYRSIHTWPVDLTSVAELMLSAAIPLALYFTFGIG